MTEKTTTASEAAHALVSFVDAARLHAKGCFWDDKKMQEDGCDGVREAAMVILNATGSFDLLIPLLGHADAGVRLNAALQLMDDRYDLAVAVLKDLDKNCLTEASGTAALALQMYGEPNRGNGFTRVEPSMTPLPGRRRAKASSG